jgi:hypothetical protein
MIVNSQTPFLVDEEAPIQKSLGRINTWSWFPTGPQTKKNYAGEGQQEFTGLDW